MSFLKYFFSKQFLISLLTIAVIWAIAIVGTFFSIDRYTHHGERITTPDFYGLTDSQIVDTCKKYNLQYIIIDSVYDENVLRGSVVDQNPAKGSFVKENRKIFLTINAHSREMVPMPDLRGVSIREATSEAALYGLKIGNLKFVPDIAKNNVLRQFIKGKEIPVGAKVYKGSVIDLEIGIGVSNEKTFVPCLYGLLLNDATDKLYASGLNSGSIIYDTNIKTSDDSSKAFVWRQSPSFNFGKTQLNLGYGVDLWLTIDSTKITLNCDSLSTDETTEETTETEDASINNE